MGEEHIFAKSNAPGQGSWHPWPPGPLTMVNSTTCNHISVYGSKERQIMVANGWPVGPHSLIIVLLTPRSLRAAKISWGDLMPHTLLRPMRIRNRAPDARLVI